MPNNTFCLYFQVTLQNENKRIGQHGKHTNCLSNESIFPFIFESHTIPSKKPARTQIYQEENIASFGKRTLFVRMASKRFATKQLYECSYLLGSIVYNLIFMSGLWYKNKSILQISGKKLSLTCIDVARIYIIAMFEHVTNTV